MKLATSVKLILLASVTLGWVACDSLVVGQTGSSSSTSAQQENPSSSQEYSFTFNRQPEVTYSALPDDTQYLPLFPILEAMGADYQWDRSQNIVSISQGDDTVKLEPGEGATRNGYPIGIPSQVADGTVWINSLSRNLSRLPGIDHASFNESEQQWQVYDFKKQTDSQTPLEKASADLIKDYLALDSEQKSRLLSPDKEITDSSYNPEELDLVKDIEIKSAVQLTSADDLNQGLVKVVARYTTDYDGQSDYEFIYSVPGETIHETTFWVRANEGNFSFDDVIAYRANRTGTGAPIPLLEEEDYLEIGREWQRMNPNANDEDLSSIIDNFVEPTLTRVNTNNDFHLSELDDEEVLARFSQQVKQSKGWQDFRSLEGSKDPFYMILEATYDGRVLSATLLGNWFVNSVSLTPILLEIELVEDEDNSWKFTRLANVRLYQNSRELELNEPETYSKIAKLVSYRRDLGVVPNFFL